jgi:hypothetical protein
VQGNNNNGGNMNIGDSVDTAVSMDVLPTLMEKGLFYIVFEESSVYGEEGYWIDEAVSTYAEAKLLVDEHFANGLTDIIICWLDKDNQVIQG